MRIAKEYHFDAAHSLPGDMGKCSHLHGHTWTVTLGVEGVLNGDGMVLDFRALKDLWRFIDDLCDHKNLNELFPNPTAENLVLVFGGMMVRELLGKHLNLSHVYVRVQEGTGGWAEDSIPISEGRIH